MIFLKLVIYYPICFNVECAGILIKRDLTSNCACVHMHRYKHISAKLIYHKNNTAVQRQCIDILINGTVATECQFKGKCYQVLHSPLSQKSLKMNCDKSMQCEKVAMLHDNSCPASVLRVCQVFNSERSKLKRNYKWTRVLN